MEFFLARQPIFHRDLTVHGYELLFRDSFENAYPDVDADDATAGVILRGFVVLDLEAVTGGRPAFVNVSQDALLRGIVEMLPPELVVIEVLESVQPTPDVTAVLRRLRHRGYRIALDDYDDSEVRRPLTEHADLIKIDFLDTTPEQRRKIFERLQGHPLEYVAEKIETRAAFEQALEEGFAYVQGYFFSRPDILSGKDVPIRKDHYLRMVDEVRKDDLDFEAMESLVKRDLSLCHKLLTYVNDPAFRWGSPVGSIREALEVLGPSETRRWVAVLSVAEMGDDRPRELVRLAVTRGHFCESLAPLFDLTDRREDLFLLGIFSELGALLGVPIETAMGRLSLASDLTDVLSGRADSATPIRSVLEMVTAYERADWQTVDRICAARGIEPRCLPGLYLDALKPVLEGFQERRIA